MVPHEGRMSHCGTSTSVLFVEFHGMTKQQDVTAQIKPVFWAGAVEVFTSGSDRNIRHWPINSLIPAATHEA